MPPVTAKPSEILGHGVDLVEVDSMRPLVESAMSSQLGQLFLEAELHAAGEGPLRLERLSGRLAAKEAVMKALGTGFGEGVSFLDVETSSHDDGSPAIRLHGKASEIAISKGIVRWMVSTSHTKLFAVASVIGLGQTQE